MGRDPRASPYKLRGIHPTTDGNVETGGNVDLPDIEATGMLAYKLRQDFQTVVFAECGGKMRSLAGVKDWGWHWYMLGSPQLHQPIGITSYGGTDIPSAMNHWIGFSNGTGLSEGTPEGMMFDVPQPFIGSFLPPWN